MYIHSDADSLYHMCIILMICVFVCVRAYAGFHFRNNRQHHDKMRYVVCM